jgi:hypothetical protein
MRTINSRSTPRTYPARHPARARGMRRKQKQGERRRKAPHQASAMSDAAAEGDLSIVNAARGKAASGKLIEP